MQRSQLIEVIERVFEAQSVPRAAVGDLTEFYALLLERVMAARNRRAGAPIVFGLCGPQGAGKSTTTEVMRQLFLELGGLTVAVLSLDDLYLPGAERARLAQQIHPLLRTRGVPGTHDVEQGIALLGRLASAQPQDRTRLPRFDKAVDEPCPTATQEWFQGRADIVIFEGWCVGAKAQATAALLDPVNELERLEDAERRWRSYVNTQLAGQYQQLFGCIDVLLMLRAPSFDCVFEWRRLQERKLAATVKAQGVPAGRLQLMDDTALRRFIMHFERVTRHLQDEMPARADLVAQLDADRRIVSVRQSG